MRYLVALAIATLLVACGGSGDPATETPQPSAPTPVAAAPTPSSTPRPMAAPTATPVPATATAPSATATRSPATVVAPPRAIATQAPRIAATATTAATPTVPAPTATASTLPTEPASTPSSEEPELILLFSEEFDGDTTLPIGVSQNGAVSGLADGYYWLESPSGRQRVSLGGSTGLTLGDGVLVVEVALDGYGAAGVFARASPGEGFGNFNYYACWLNSEGAAGCDISIDGDIHDLFSTEAGEIPVYDLNELSLIVEGGTIIFIVNDVEIGPIVDPTLGIGSWGIFADSYKEAFVAWFDYVILAEIPAS